MQLAKETPNGLFKITIRTVTTEETPLLPDDLRQLSATLEDLARQIRVLARKAMELTPASVN